MEDDEDNFLLCVGNNRARRKTDASIPMDMSDEEIAEEEPPPEGVNIVDWNIPIPIEDVDRVASNLMATQVDNDTITSMQLHFVARRLHQLWCTTTDDLLYTTQRVMCILTQDIKLMDARFSNFGILLSTIKSAMEYKTQEGTLDAEIAKDIDQLLTETGKCMYFGREMMLNANHIQYISDTQKKAALPRTRLESYFHTGDEDAKQVPSNFLRLFDYFIEQIGRRALRRVGDQLYCPVFNEDDQYTYTYEHWKSIEGFIYWSMYPRELHQPLRIAMYEKGSSRAHELAKQLEKAKADEIPDVEECDDWWSYSNGIYDKKMCLFYPHVADPQYCGDRTSQDLDHSKVAVKYINLRFEYHKYQDAMKSRRLNAEEVAEFNRMIAQLRDIGEPEEHIPVCPEFVMDPMLIPTPAIDSILTSQGFSEEVKKWFYIMMGRMFYKVGERDKWQVFPFCKGVAGTGKSTLLRLLCYFFKGTDIGILMNQGRQNFSLQSIYDKKIFFCMDLDGNFNFDQARWNSMVTGEWVAIEKLYEVSEMMDWRVPGAFAGNADPPFIDRGGSASRRMFIFEFLHFISKADPTLLDRCRNEMPAFMYKVTSLYTAMAEDLQNVSLWDTEERVIPQYFFVTMNKLAANACPLSAFMMNSGMVTKEHGAHCSWQEFHDAYIRFIDQEKIPKANRSLKDDDCKKVFSQLNIKIVPKPLQQGNHPYHAKYLRNCSINVFMGDGNDDDDGMSA